MNMNNQTETTKRKGSRVFALLTVLCLIVAMAVPALAAEDNCSISGKWLWNDTISRISEQNESVYYSVKFSMEFLDGVRYFDSIGQKYDSYYNASHGNVVLVLLDFMTDGASNSGGKTYWYYNSITHEVGWRDPFSLIINFGDEKQSVDEAFYTWFTSNAVPIITPPDIGEVTTDTLPVVLGWIQSVITAIFVGEMNGFLILAAVPVAIVIVFLGARLLRRLFWGA